MIASRYLPALVSLLALAAVPTVLHSYLDTMTGDGRQLEAISRDLNGIHGQPSSGRSPQLVSEQYGTTDFIERQYGPTMTLFVIRSYDPKKLYHHPELGVAHGDAFQPAVVTRTPERPEVPIFVLESTTGRVSVYALFSDGRFIEHPMRYQLGNALGLLASPKKPMTLFFVRGRLAGAVRPSPSSATALLLAAIDSFVAQSGRATP